MCIRDSQSALEGFVKIVEMDSFSAAAEALYLSQSALSQQIRTLEGQLQFELFQHVPRRVILTPAGRDFYPKACLLYTSYAAANGLNFRVIEQNANVQDTRHWYGAIDSAAAKEAGEKPADRAKLLSEISRYASGKCDQRVVKTWINESAAMHDFMRSILEDKYGWVCDFTSGSEAAWPTENAEHNTDYLFPVQEHNYMASESASGLARNELLLQYIQELGYDVDFKTSLAKLEKNSEGRITGIIAQSTEDDHVIRYNANKGVLLACGGFPGNPYMMEQLDPLGTSVTTACSY